MQKRSSFITGFEKGFSLVEVIVASAIISVALLAVIGVAAKSIALSGQALDTYNATVLLEEGGEIARVMRDTSWSTFDSFSKATPYYAVFDGTNWTLSSTPNTIGMFTRTIMIDAVERDSNDEIVPTGNGTVDPGTVLVSVKVTWQERGTTFSKSLSFYIANIFS